LALSTANSFPTEHFFFNSTVSDLHFSIISFFLFSRMAFTSYCFSFCLPSQTMEAEVSTKHSQLWSAGALFSLWRYPQTPAVLCYPDPQSAPHPFPWRGGRWGNATTHRHTCCVWLKDPCCLLWESESNLVDEYRSQDQSLFFWYEIHRVSLMIDFTP
jgi:hypothetical protein